MKQEWKQEVLRVCDFRVDCGRPDRQDFFNLVQEANSWARSEDIRKELKIRSCVHHMIDLILPVSGERPDLVIMSDKTYHPSWGVYLVDLLWSMRIRVKLETCYMEGGTDTTVLLPEAVRQDRLNCRHVLNLTQHEATFSQALHGVEEPDPVTKEKIRELLTFEAVPDAPEMIARANCLSILAFRLGAVSVMIGGAPYFMSYLEGAMRTHRIQYLYSFSERVVEEVYRPDGSVQKNVLFRHMGWVK